MTTGKLTLGILEVGRPPAELPGYPGYGTMSAKWLEGLGTENRIWHFDKGDRPTNPDEADIWLITGSRYGAYDDLPWIKPLEQFVVDCRDANVPMIGICFGHQIIAQALGGTVAKSDKGWGLGIHDYTVADWPAELGPAPDGLHLQAFHRDQVENPAPGAECIAGSDFCEYAAFWYPGWGFTVQGHPEIRPDYAHDLLTSKRGKVYGEEEADRALASQINPDNAADLVPRIAAALLKKTGAQKA